MSQDYPTDITASQYEVMITRRPDAGVFKILPKLKYNDSKNLLSRCLFPSVMVFLGEALLST